MEYMGILICIASLFIIWKFGKKISFDGIVAPQSLNSMSFLPSLFLLLFYVNKWNVNLSGLTISLIIIQPLIFTCISSITKRLVTTRSFKHNDSHSKYKIDALNILCFTFIQIISLIAIFGYEISVVGSVANLSKLMFYFRYKVADGDGVDLPTMVSILRLISIYAGFIWEYLLIVNFLEKEKQHNKLYILNLCLSFFSTLVMGARGDAIMLMMAGIILFLFIWQRKIMTSNILVTSKRREKRKFNKYVYVVLVLCILIATQFDKIANLIGRDTSDFSGIYYLAIYLAAPIKNLDSFLRNGCLGFASSFGNSKTLGMIIAYLAPRYFGFTPHYKTFGYEYVNGYFLGNVGTAYANFYYDYGIVSFIAFSSIMAILTSYVYAKTLRMYSDVSNTICISLIIYSIMAFGLLFNFFANEYYNTVFNIGFLRGIIILFFVKWFLTKVHLKFK